MCYVITWRIYKTEDSRPISGMSDLVILMVTICSTLRNTALNDREALKKFNVGKHNWILM